MPPDLKIRRAVPADAECLITYMTRLVNEPHNNIVLDPGQWRLTVREETEFLRQTAEDSNKFFIVAEIPEGIVGVANITRNARPTATHTASLAVSVDAAWRRQGIGGALMGAMLEWAQNKKLRRIELKVFTRNTAAIPLYRKFGFMQEGLHRMVFCKQGLWVDEYTMALLLPA